MGMKDTRKTRAATNEAIELQTKGQASKGKAKSGKNMEKATEEFIETLYYHRMYYSDAC